LPERVWMMGSVVRTMSFASSITANRLH
jgi:hypothetical protein